ncbi:MAG: hypothetical protein Q4A83_07800 [Bacillota bacterium]|nr:hypothetical protein [Bacillota bacterium]
MGMWGFGVTQSDEYCEVYDRFMEQYDEGFDVSDITEVILDDYLADFDPDDGILHDVYFAIAKAQWQCGGIEPEILKKVTEIIESGSNIEFLRELEADEDGLKQRKRNLKSFLKTLNTPCKTVRKRKGEKSEENSKLPPLVTGGCYLYKYGENYRSFVVLECLESTIVGEAVLCAISFDHYDGTPDFERVQNATIGGFGCYSAEEFFNEDQLMLLGQIAMPADMYDKLFRRIPMSCKKDDFKTADFSAEFKLSVLDIAKAADFDAQGKDANGLFNKNLGDVRVSLNGIIMTMPWNGIFGIK